MSADYPPPVQYATPPLRDDQRESQGPKARSSEGDPQGDYPTNGGLCQKPPAADTPPLVADFGVSLGRALAVAFRLYLSARTVWRGGRVTPPARNHLAPYTVQNPGGQS